MYHGDRRRLTDDDEKSQDKKGAVVTTGPKTIGVVSACRLCSTTVRLLAHLLLERWPICSQLKAQDAARLSVLSCMRMTEQFRAVLRVQQCVRTVSPRCALSKGSTCVRETTYSSILQLTVERRKIYFQGSTLTINRAAYKRASDEFTYKVN
jgi:hypothetical protein